MKNHALARTICSLTLGVSSLAIAGNATRSVFGKLADGREVDAVTLTNSAGMSVRVIAYGARVQSIVTPDRNGKSGDLVLGYDSMQGYLEKRQYFGATVGRFANRIAKGKFQLDGKNYQLTLNDGPNSLHGGTKGFDTQLWKVIGSHDGPQADVTFQYVSADGDQGYPGQLTVTATYALNETGQLTIDYKATTDKPTIVNISNHTYWNLSGDGTGSVMDDRLMIPADAITPVDATQIPTGEFRPVSGTPFDFRRPTAIGARIRDGRSRQLLLGHGYDMNWVIGRNAAPAPRLVARVEDPTSGRVLTLYSAQPGLQFYSGNFLDGTTKGKSERIYRQGDAFVLEPQIFPDTPNQPLMGSGRLDPGKTYENRIIYQFSVIKGH